MNNFEQCLKFDSLSVVASAIEPPTAVSCLGLSVWCRLGQQLVDRLARAHTLQVWQRLDRFGNRYWQAYDPTTGRSTASGSEAEIRAWLEERRY